MTNDACASASGKSVAASAIMLYGAICCARNVAGWVLSQRRRTQSEDTYVPRPFGGRVKVLGVIPARYASTRFPGKPLAILAGKPMIWHTYTNAKKCRILDHLVVATDDQRILDAVHEFGGQALLTDPACANGTERCLEVLQRLQKEGHQYDIVVNIQGDEPMIEEEHIDKVVAVVRDSSAVMGTLARPANRNDEQDVANVNNVKTVLDVHGNALYFSRAIIPHNKKGAYDPGTHYWRKLGIYSYRADFLPLYTRMPPSLLQKAEDLEQNKVIEAGYSIRVGIVREAVHGVDYPEQLQRLNKMLAAPHDARPPAAGSQISAHY